ncbi:ABC transporter permease [Actinokineospora globicatena]|uniref:Glycine/betaine ABC transporter permease n=1 Tax=Actinokineospora globicatena TaxID=103729 RepID=A0A9W6VBG9_9PSEU|nr:ABC transporter permease [Actinokineospora globicatena]MCP2302159.1 osmoprotectant transport system permease protein [Actinokineospora globicatena]GLW76180.1 glycine/betaine ABC transporter permease [Actinokineospora globicatena]GLW83016.1 glycine/betaine ABC transporter permease [Actinokineospora globicatena]GLW95297.1 glycine/betaine ABC transporter permease [Actinokineospora globicatena]
MSVFDQVGDWLTNPDNWKTTLGIAGVPQRLGEHLHYTGLAVLIAAVIAIPLGAYIGHTGRGGTIVVGVVNSFRALPEVGLLILLVLAMGLTLALEAVTIALVLLAVPVLLAGTYSGVRNVDRAAVDAARGMGMSEWEILLKVELPNALPLILGAVRSATLQVIATASIAAVVSLGGLGRFVIDGNALREYDQMAAGAVLIAGLAIVVELLLTGLQWLVVSPGLRKKTSRRTRARTAVPTSG